jgi:hypothetical protein
MASTWNTIRRPLIGAALGGVPGATVGLGMDMATGDGMFDMGAVDSGNYDGMPAYPGYNPIYDPSTMALLPYAESQLQGIDPNTKGLEQFREEALRTGPSAWARMARANQYAEEANQRERGGREVAGQTARARADMAMRGGSTSGARERIAQGGVKNFIDMSQNVGRQGTLNRMQVDINDEQNRVQQLGMLPGMEVQAVQPKLQKAQMMIGSRQGDVQNAMMANQSLNKFNMDKYNTEGQIWGAGKQADATARSGGGGALGSWLCTEAGNWDNLFDRTLLKKLQRFALKKAPKVVRFYLQDCAELIKRMRESADTDWVENRRFISEIVKLTREDKLEEAFEKYDQRVRALVAKYWPECDHPVIRGHKEAC